MIGAWCTVWRRGASAGRWRWPGWLLGLAGPGWPGTAGSASAPGAVDGDPDGGGRLPGRSAGRRAHQLPPRGGHRRRSRHRRVLGGGLGRWGLLVQRPVLRLGRGPDPGPTGGRGGTGPRRGRVLAGGLGRRGLRLRRRRVLRFRGRPPPQPAGGRAWPRRRTGAGTGWWPRTAGSSPSGTPGSSARPGRCTSTARWWAWPPAPDGGGYWLVASDGGVFTFGDAGFFGSTGSMHLNRPVVGMAAAPDGGGYWLVASDGGLFSFGTAGFSGAATGRLRRSAAGMAATGGGYRIVSSDGGVYPFGTAPFYGSVDVPPMVGEVVAVDPGHDGGNAGAAGFIARPIDGGGLTESCDTVGTETAAGYTEHAFNFDVATRLEALLQAEGATVVMTRTTDTGVGPLRRRPGRHRQRGRGRCGHLRPRRRRPTGRPGLRRRSSPLPVVSPISDNTAVVPASAGLASADTVRRSPPTPANPSRTTPGRTGSTSGTTWAGLNLTTVPKVLIECANMQNPADASLTESPQWRQQAAQGLADGITSFLESEQAPCGSPGHGATGRPDPQASNPPASMATTSSAMASHRRGQLVQLALEGGRRQELLAVDEIEGGQVAELPGDGLVGPPRSRDRGAGRARPPAPRGATGAGGRPPRRRPGPGRGRLPGPRAAPPPRPGDRGRRPATGPPGPAGPPGRSPASGRPPARRPGRSGPPCRRRPAGRPRPTSDPRAIRTTPNSPSAPRQSAIRAR